MILKSHPNKLLEEHLLNVAENSKQEILSKELNLSLIDKKDLSEISFLIGISHDFGKATGSFQEFIKDLEKGKKGRAHNDHSTISSLFCFELVKEYCNNKKISAIFAWISGAVVRWHHGDLESPFKLFKDINIYDLKKILEDLKIHELKDLYESFSFGKVNFEMLFNRVFSINTAGDYSILNNVKNPDDYRLFSILRKSSDKEKLELFLIAEFLYSILLDFDKKEAANILDIPIKKIDIPDNLVASYIKKRQKESLDEFNPENQLNKIKNDLFKNVTSNKNLIKENRIYTLTAPTGSGKTFASFASAIKLRSKLNKSYKIIYVLPYTSIIDQNYTEFENILNFYYQQDFEKNTSEYIIKHHYLSNLNFKKENYSSDNYLDDLLFIKSWESNIIVSTYIQLLYSIIGNKGSFLNKFHNIVNSIIILDEVQFIEVKYWKLIKLFFEILSKKFNVYFIFMSATQPLIFDDNSKIIELCNDNSIFKTPLYTERIEYNIKGDLEFEEFKNNFLVDFKNSPKNRILVILNTRRCAREFHKFLINNKGLFGSYSLFHLSTNNIPLERKKRINEIKKLSKSSGSKYIIVTTQLIEAGVDITSDVVYRDLAPFDSLIQSAGRCNRYNELTFDGKKGLMNIISLKDSESKKFFYSQIYKNSFEIDKSKKMLEFLKNEGDLLRLSKEYFKLIKENEHCEHLINNLILRLKFEEIFKEFKLISKVYPTVPLLIPLNKKEEYDINKKLEEYSKLRENLNRSSYEKFKIIGKLKKIRTELEMFIVNVSEKEFNYLYSNGLIEDIGKIHVLKENAIQSFYYEDVGFFIEDDELKEYAEKNGIDSAFII